jgi:hypothetical protein
VTSPAFHCTAIRSRPADSEREREQAHRSDSFLRGEENDACDSGIINLSHRGKKDSVLNRGTQAKIRQRRNDRRTNRAGTSDPEI